MAGHSWIYEDSGPRAGVFNMERDEALAAALQDPAGSGAQVLRLYGWAAACDVAGTPSGCLTIDEERLRQDGIDLVRRPTGGRAILHHEELTYCVVMLAGRRSILQVYNEISEALVRGLALYGVDGGPAEVAAGFCGGIPGPVVDPVLHQLRALRDRMARAEAGGECAAALADGERDVVLQHGSILCGPAHRRLADYLTDR